MDQTAKMLYVAKLVVRFNYSNFKTKDAIIDQKKQNYPADHIKWLYILTEHCVIMCYN